MTDYNRIVFILNLQTHKTKVRFALYCAYGALEHVGKEDKLVVEKTLEPVSKWLETGNITAKELKDAAYATAYATHAANATAYAANAATYAATYATAYAAANAAANAAAKEEKYKQYLNYLVKISDFTELEKELYIT